MEDRNSYCSKIEIAGIPLLCKYELSETSSYFKKWINDEKRYYTEIQMSEWFKQRWVKEYGPFTPVTEFSALSITVSTKLLDHDCCLFHSCAIEYKGYAWMICGPSGVGKSTQAKTLISEFDNEIKIICGDRPVLKLREDNTFEVSPSPWNGKEGWHGGKTSPLKGIICLSRSDTNSISKLKPADAAAIVFTSIILTSEYKEYILKAAAFENKLLKNIQVWSLKSHTVPDSTRILYKLIKEESKQ